MVADGNAVSGKWTIEIVTKNHPGEDNRVRNVTSSDREKNMTDQQQKYQLSTQQKTPKNESTPHGGKIVSWETQVLSYAEISIR